MSEAPKSRLILFTVAASLFMMAVVSLAQYLVGGRVSTGVMVAIGVPTGIVLGQSLANKK